MLRDAGAREVHLRIASPPIKTPCFYGVDISTYDELICARKQTAEVCESLGADSLAFLSTGALFEAGRRSELCLACFTGEYPTALRPVMSPVRTSPLPPLAIPALPVVLTYTVLGPGIPVSLPRPGTHSCRTCGFPTWELRRIIPGLTSTSTSAPAAGRPTAIPAGGQTRVL